MLREVVAAYGEFDADDDLRAAVLYREGTIFTAVLDLASVASDIVNNVSHVPDGGINPWQVDARQLSKPMVAAVHSKVLTLDIELMPAGDIVIAAESAASATSPRSGARCATAAVNPPPALAPPRPIRAGSTHD